MSGGAAALRAVPVLLGAASVAGSLALAAAFGAFAWWHWAMAAAGAGAMLGGILWQQDANWRHALASLVYTFFAVLCAVLLYLISANRLAVWDLTEDSLFTLAPQTRSLLRELPAGAEIRVVAFEAAAAHAELDDLFELYRREAPGLSLEAVDPDLDLARAREVDEAPLLRDLVVTRHDGGKAARRVKAKLPASPGGRERALTNAIAEAAYGRDRRIYFTTGHGEFRFRKREQEPAGQEGMLLATFAEQLEQRAWPVAELKLVEGVPEDAAAVVVAGPKIDLYDYERDTLREYLDAGGRVLLLLEPLPSDAGMLPNVSSILEAAGLGSPNMFIIDPLSQRATGSVFTPIASVVGDHPIVQGTNGQPMLFDGARPVVPAQAPPPNVAAWLLTATMNDAWAETPRELRENPGHESPPDDRQRGRIPVAAAAAWPAADPRLGDEARLVVVGDASTFMDRIITNESALFGLAALNWLGGREELLDVPPKLIDSTPVLVGARTLWALAAALLAIGLGVGAGGVSLALLRRRRR
ncbi:MAG: Gldg family protein [Candidatus Sumerlaeia bacterium]|nr:Gldg family protein [Candidatus Sumerlaeia bacterium]